MRKFYENKPFVELLIRLRKEYPSWLNPIYVGEDTCFMIFEVNINEIKPRFD
jgi:hypothetical protein